MLLRRGLAWMGAWVPSQPHTAVVCTAAAVAALGWAWAQPPAAEDPSPPVQIALVVLFLGATLLWATTHPLHLRHKVKVHLTTLPLYLMAVLAPPFLAGAAAGAGVLLGQLRMRPHTGNLPSDIATAVSRWVILVTATSGLAHWEGLAGRAEFVRLVGSAGLMFVLDVATAPLELAPMLGEPPLAIARSTVREGGLYEAAQYLAAILASAAALYQPWTLALLPVPTYLLYIAFRNAKEVHDGTFKLLESMADAVDLRDPYTGGHSRRVAHLARELLQQVNLRGPEADLITSAARIHDLGKIGVPDHILNKTGGFTPEEKALMDSHSVRGAELLARFPDFARGQAIVRHHHERWDGGGYPDRLHAWEIPFGARVIAVVDSFDAMTSDRPYRAAMSMEQASSILRAGRGSQWDPALVDAFLQYLEVLPTAAPQAAKAKLAAPVRRAPMAAPTRQ